MTPHKDSGRGSFVIDRKLPHIGRIKRASGTTHKPTFKAINAMIDGLYERGRLDLLRALRDGVLAPLVIYDAWRSNALERLPSAEMLVPLLATWRQWAPTYEHGGEEHRQALVWAANKLARAATDRTAVAELPAVLATLRALYRAEGKAQTFNHLRTYAQAFVRDLFKRHSALWLEVSAVEPVRVTAKRRKHPLTVAEMDALGQWLRGYEASPGYVASRAPKGSYAEAADVLVAMCLTGAGPKEFWGPIDVRPDRLHIHGTKRETRDRDVPRVAELVPVRPTIRWRVFAERLKVACDALDMARVTPYDLRRTYANYLEAAGVTRTRRRHYLGHAASDSTDLYEAHEVRQYLGADAERIARYLAEQRGAQQGGGGLRLVREGGA